jgi:hypothetical protein
VSSLEKCFLKYFAHFFNWVIFLLLSCLSLLHILYVHALSVVWFVNIFFHHVGCLFILLFPVQKLFSLNFFYSWMCFSLYSYIHMYIHCLGHFSPPPSLLLPHPPTLTSRFQAEPVLPFSPILLKRRQKQ